jgi:hypothetical protein
MNSFLVGLEGQSIETKMKSIEIHSYQFISCRFEGQSIETNLKSIEILSYQ